MALTTCRECGAEVSDQARTCLRCGAPQPANLSWSGTGFEWKSARTYGGYPLVHIAFGRDRRGKLRVAKGVIAIGQFALGLVTVAQFGVGLLFGFGQFLIGGFVLAQFAGALVAGVGQIATGYAAIGQVVLAYYGLGQIGAGEFLWTMTRRDAEAVQFFLSWWSYLKQLIH
ncbi:MAG TPA: zinc ribbon domain-containing protein [Desulfobaccales bacterium]|nr:zinc ribbon domain-containing protein [Desulfobaccales bacterium]